MATNTKWAETCQLLKCAETCRQLKTSKQFRLIPPKVSCLSIFEKIKKYVPAFSHFFLENNVRFGF